MDAHAWVEAWDAEQRQWIIVEATAQEGLDDVSLADELARGAGGGRPLLTLLVESLYEYGLFGVIGVVWRFTGLVLVLLTVVIVARMFRSGRMTWRRRSHPQEREDLAVLHRLLLAMDRKTKALGYRRQPDETLHAFAGRISRRSSEGVSRTDPSAARVRSTHHTATALDWLASWYLQYADLRYARVLDPTRIEQLQRLAQEPPTP